MVIVCCAVGHAATKVRPLISRPVPRTTLAGSGRCAPGRPMRYTHNMPSSRQGRSAGPGAAPGKYALLDTRATSTCSGATTRGGNRHVQGRARSTPEQGTLNVPRRDTDTAPAIVRIAHHRGVKADRDVVQKHLAVDRPDIDSYLMAVLERGELTRRISDVGPGGLGEVVSRAAGHHDQRDVVLKCHRRNGAHRSVSSCGDQYRCPFTHCVSRKGCCPVTGAQLTHVDEPLPGGATDGGLVDPETG